MATIIAKIVDIYPKYGAKELKVEIRKNTFGGFVITSSSMIILFLIGLLTFFNVKTEKLEYTGIPGGVITIIELSKEKPITIEMKVPVENKFFSGTKEKAGNPIPVNDALVKPSEKDFATIENIAISSSTEGPKPIESGLGNPFKNGDMNIGIIEPKDEDPSIDDFIIVEKEPSFDYARLSKLVKYPEIARKAGIEGKVFVNVLVGKDGLVRKVSIENSDNIILNQAAIDAVNEYGKFNPAIQNGEPIAVWVTIPIHFKLK